MHPRCGQNIQKSFDTLLYSKLFNLSFHKHLLHFSNGYTESPVCNSLIQDGRGHLFQFLLLHLLLLSLNAHNHVDDYSGTLGGVRKVHISVQLFIVLWESQAVVWATVLAAVEFGVRLDCCQLHILSCCQQKWTPHFVMLSTEVDTTFCHAVNRSGRHILLCCQQKWTSHFVMLSTEVDTTFCHAVNRSRHLCSTCSVVISIKQIKPHLWLQYFLTTSTNFILLEN